MSQNPERLKSLSISQPWAELILRGEKTEEYRSQPTNIRGTVYVYASQTPADIDDQFRADLEVDLGMLQRLPMALVVGTVEIMACREDAEGGYAWELANPKRLALPLKPIEHPHPVWFHPFGRPEDIENVQELVTASPIPSSIEMRFNRGVISNVPTVATPYHAKYFAHDLTRRGAEGVDRLSMSLFDAAVDLNPHQIEATLFAIQSTLSIGVVLADEVGLGKT